MVRPHDATRPLSGRPQSPAGRGATARMRLIRPQPASIGFRSYEYGGRMRTLAAPSVRRRGGRRGSCGRPGCRALRCRLGGGSRHTRRRGVDGGGPGAERRAFGLDVRTIEHRRARPFFLNTSTPAAEGPARCWTGGPAPRGGGWRLYVPLSQSAALHQGIERATDHCRRSHRSKVATPTSKRAATAAHVPSPASYARTARTRSSTGYGFGVRAVDHSNTINSSELWL